MLLPQQQERKKERTDDKDRAGGRKLSALNMENERWWLVTSTQPCGRHSNHGPLWWLPYHHVRSCLFMLLVGSHSHSCIDSHTHTHRLSCTVPCVERWVLHTCPFHLLVTTPPRKGAFTHSDAFTSINGSVITHAVTQTHRIVKHVLGEKKHWIFIQALTGDWAVMKSNWGAEVQLQFFLFYKCLKHSVEQAVDWFKCYLLIISELCEDL